MATISNTPRPGYIFDSTDNVWYPIGVGGHSHGEISATIVDAKGDLIVASAADTVTKLAAGTASSEEYASWAKSGRGASIHTGMEEFLKAANPGDEAKNKEVLNKIHNAFIKNIKKSIL